MRRDEWSIVGFLVFAAICLGALVLSLLSPGCAQAQSSSWPLAWTASGDDSTAGTATSLMVFYSPTLPDTTGLTAWLNAGGTATTRPAGITTWINGASNAVGPTPLPAGSAQAFTIAASFLGGVKYWAMVRTCDDAGNCAYSNFAVRTTQVVDVWPPRPVRDLRNGP